MSETQYHSSESKLSKFEDVDDCCHEDYIVQIGKMEESGIDSVYNVPFFCSNCNHFVAEVYNYEGIEKI